MKGWIKHCLINWRWWVVFPIAMANVPLVLIQLLARSMIPVMEFIDEALESLGGYTLKPFVRWWRINKERTP